VRFRIAQRIVRLTQFFAKRAIDGSESALALNKRVPLVFHRSASALLSKSDAAHEEELRAISSSSLSTTGAVRIALQHGSRQHVLEFNRKLFDAALGSAPRVRAHADRRLLSSVAAVFGTLSRSESVRTEVAAQPSSRPSFVRHRTASVPFSLVAMLSPPFVRSLRLALLSTRARSQVPQGSAWADVSDPQARVAVGARVFANTMIGQLGVSHEEKVGASTVCDDPSPLASLSSWASGHSAFPLSIGVPSPTEACAMAARRLARILTSDCATLSPVTLLTLASQELPLPSLDSAVTAAGSGGVAISQLCRSIEESLDLVRSVRPATLRVYVASFLRHYSFEGDAHGAAERVVAATAQRDHGAGGAEPLGAFGAVRGLFAAVGPLAKEVLEAACDSQRPLPAIVAMLRDAPAATLSVKQLSVELRGILQLANAVSVPSLGR
jgi:hypothetical protein